MRAKFVNTAGQDITFSLTDGVPRKGDSVDIEYLDRYGDIMRIAGVVRDVCWLRTERKELEVIVMVGERVVE